jgi:hypothetical protein
MRRHLDVATDPFDTRLELVMPGVQDRFNGISTNLQHVKNSNQEIHSAIQTLQSTVQSSDTNNSELITLVKDLNTHVQKLSHATAEGMKTAMRLMNREDVFQGRGTQNLMELNGISEANATNNVRDSEQSGTRERQEQSELTGPNHDLPVHLPNAPRLSQRYASLSRMWDEWHGTGSPDTRDKPIPGGFHELEQVHRTGWRKHLL